MAARFRRSGATGAVTDHNELINRGIRTHDEIDSYLDEIDAARGGKADLDKRLDDIESINSTQTTDINGLTTRVGNAEGKITDQGTRLTTAEGKITDQGTRLTTAEGKITDHGTRVTALETEIQAARGGKPKLDDRLLELESNQAADLKILSATYDATANKIVVRISEGDASINGSILRKLAENFEITNPAVATTYYIFLNADGTYSRQTDQVEPASSMIIGSVTVGATANALSTKDLRYFLTKGGNSQTSDEVVAARTDTSGIVFDNLKARLDDMQGKIGSGPAPGGGEPGDPTGGGNLGVRYWEESSKGVRTGPQTDFTVPEYTVGTHNLMVIVEGIVLSPQEDYVELNSTTVRFNDEIPVDQRVIFVGLVSVGTGTDLGNRVTALEESRETDIVYSYNTDLSVKSESTYSIDTTPVLLKQVDYVYDSGRVVSETVTQHSKTFRKTYLYDAAGNVTSIQTRQVV